MFFRLPLAFRQWPHLFPACGPFFFRAGLYCSPAGPPPVPGRVDAQMQVFFCVLLSVFFFSPFFPPLIFQSIDFFFLFFLPSSEPFGNFFLSLPFKKKCTFGTFVFSSLCSFFPARDLTPSYLICARFSLPGAIFPITLEIPFFFSKREVEFFHLFFPCLSPCQ